MRIRTIKPEFWRSDDIAQLDLATRLLYVGLWSYVDDAGRGVDNPASIAADLFAPDLAREDGANAPEVFARVRGGLATLSDNGLIGRYQSDGHRYLHVIAWLKHQRIDKPTKSRFPEPPTEDGSDKGKQEIPGGLPEDSMSPRDDSMNAPEDSTPGTGEQGSRGTGEEEQSSSADAVTEKQPRAANAYTAEFEQWWSLYPHRKGSKYTASQKFKAALKVTTMDVLTAATIAYARSVQGREPKYVQNGETWLNKRMWEADLQPLMDTSAPLLSEYEKNRIRSTGRAS